MATHTHIAPKDASEGPAGGPSDTASTAHSNMQCPDPSAHKPKDAKLQDFASAAALRSTGSRTDANPLGPDGKLSSASAATSLKHAKAHDLPSFPSVGIDTLSSAGAAATLADANKKSPEWWKPEQSSAAGKAALLANGYKMDPRWQPEASSAGSKAALLAHKEGPKTSHWTPEATTHGHSAATIAMGRRSPAPSTAHDDAGERRRKALLAATGAVSDSGRKRAQSTPAPPQRYPDSANSAKNALSAATLAHRPSVKSQKAPSPSTATDSNRMGSGAMEAARIQHSKSVSRDMYTSSPPVSLEVEEKKRQDALRASAISMAQKMYDVQQQHIDEATGRSRSRSHAQSGATAAQTQPAQSSGDEDIKQQAMRYIGIQEAAQKLAAERLAKIGPDEHEKMRSYYGYDKPSRSKLSIRRGRNRASSNPNPEPADDSSDDDELRSRRIRSQMSQFNKTLAEVDAKKRDQDRKSLVAAAERKVQAQMLGMDKKIYDKTGKMSDAMVDDWDAKARAKALANSEARLENHGRIHLGHGKYMEQADIDAVAQARIQPTLDEIAEKTEKRRAEEEEQRLEMEEKKRQAQIEREHAAEVKAEEKKLRGEEKRAAKAKSAEEKAAAKQEKEAEKQKKDEEKRAQKEEQQKSKEANKPATTEGAPAATTANELSDSDQNRDSTSHNPPEPTTEEPSSSTSPTTTSPTSPQSKGIKSFLHKFKRRSKPNNAEPDKQPGFIGGNSLRQSTSQPSISQPGSTHTSTPASPAPVSATRETRTFSDVSSISSAGPAAGAEEDTTAAAAAASGEGSNKKSSGGGGGGSRLGGLFGGSGRGRSPKRPLSGASAVSGQSEYEEARDGLGSGDENNDKLELPPSLSERDDASAAGGKGSPSRDSRFREVGI